MNASSSTACQSFQPHDAVVLIDIQNCFMEQRAVRWGQSPSYPLDADWQSTGTIPAGPLWVSDSTAVVDTANAWLSFVAGSGGGTVIATLDYHPPGHCSFCDAHHDGIESGIYCVTGVAHSTEEYKLSFNVSHRCKDAISESDYLSAQYFQWRHHCVAGSVGARFDPYLNPLPADAVVVKLGTEEMYDDYDAFSSPHARVSTAPAGMHDTQPTATAQTSHPLANSLREELESAGTKRLFIMGLATDYVVKRTVYEALKATQNLTVALISAGTRGIVPAESQEVLNCVADSTSCEDVDRNGYVLSSPDPISAMAELCVGTCDADAYTTQCSADQFCQMIDDFSWGKCVSCGCHNGGACQADGTCLCPFPYAGADCTGGWTTATFTAFVTAVSLLIFMVLSVILAYRFRKRLARFVHRALGAKLLLDATSQPPVLDLPPSCRWHLFLSHVWSSGQDQVAVIRRRLQDEMVPETKIFLDVEDLDDISRLEEYIRASAAVLIFLSRGYFLSRNCLREVRAAVNEEKPLVLVHEIDPQKGGAPLDEIMRECPDDLRDAVFRGRDVVPWLRLGHFQRESLCCIAESMLLCLPRYGRQLGRGKLGAFDLTTASADAPADAPLRGLPVHIKGAITESHWRLPGGACLYVIEDYNPGALGIARQLVEGYPGAPAELAITQSAPDALVSHREVPQTELGRAGRSSGHGRSLERHSTLKRIEQSDAKGKFKATGKATVKLAVTGKARDSARARRVGPAPVASDNDLETPPAPAPDVPSEPKTAPTPSEPSATHVLLLLSIETFVGEKGEALAREIRAARRAGLPILMIHQTDPALGGCPFERFFSVTPEDLIRDGLYRALAVPWYPGAHMRVSCAVAAQALGAHELPNQRDKRQFLSRLRQLDPVHLRDTGSKVTEFTSPTD